MSIEAASLAWECVAAAKPQAEVRHGSVLSRAASELQDLHSPVSVLQGFHATRMFKFPVPGSLSLQKDFLTSITLNKE